MKMRKRWLSLVLALCLTLTMFPTAVFAAETAAQDPAETVAGNGVTATRTEKPAELDLMKNTFASQTLLEDARDESEMVRVIVVLEGASLLEQGFAKSEITAY